MLIILQCTGKVIGETHTKMLYSSKCLESLQTVFGQTILKYTWSLFLVIAFVFAFVVLYLSLSICHRLFVCGLRLLSLSMSLILRLYQTQCTTKDGEIALLKASQEATELSCSAKDNQLQQLRADMADAVVVYLFVALSLSLSLSLCADRRQSR